MKQILIVEDDSFLNKMLTYNPVSYTHLSKVRTGQVRVLLGSTAKMGAGTNVQDRLVALHDLDCPWRPGDLAQRKGRIERQGNQNPLVHVYRYVTEGTFDAYLWHCLLYTSPKAKFQANVNAIRLLKELEAAGQQASPEQQEILSRYVGWGGLSDAFDPEKPAWALEYAQLKELLTTEEYAAARSSTLNAHYTSPCLLYTSGSGIRRQ